MKYFVLFFAFFHSGNEDPRQIKVNSRLTASEYSGAEAETAFLDFVVQDRERALRDREREKEERDRERERREGNGVVFEQ